MKAWISHLRHCRSQGRDAESPDHLLCAVLTPNGSRTSVSGQCIVDILAHLGSTKGILEAMTERVEYVRSVMNTKVADVTAKPFRPSLTEAAPWAGGKQWKQASTRSSFASCLFYEPQKPDADEFGMHRHNTRRARGLQPPILLWVFADCDHRDLAGLVGRHISCRKRTSSPRRAPVNSPSNGNQNAASPRPAVGRAALVNTADVKSSRSSSSCQGSRVGLSSDNRMFANGSAQGKSSAISPLSLAHRATACTPPRSLLTVALDTRGALGWCFDHSTSSGSGA